MARIFISYSRKNVDEVVQLGSELKARGLCLWQDISDLSLGHPTEEQIRHSLAEDCDTYLVYLTPQSLISRYVMEVELRAAIQQWRQNSDFAVIPVFRNLSIQKAKAATINQLGEDITLFNGIRIKRPKTGKPEELRSQLGAAARLALQAALERHRREFQDTEELRLVLHLHTRQYTRYAENPDLDLDWRPFFEGKDAPSPLDCSITLLPALHQIKETVAAVLGPRTMHVRAKAHLSAGVALGFAFRATTGFHLDVEQDSALWSSRAEVKEETPLVVSETPGAIDSEELAVELSVTHDVSAGVDRLIQQQGRLFRARLVLRPETGPERDRVLDGAHAQAIAMQVARELRRVCNQYNALKSHLFMATPLGLAILIGHQLNACGPVQTYEYSNQHSIYVPSFLLV